MKYLRNPITSEVRQVTRLEAKRLLPYGWVRSDAAQHWQYQRQVREAVVERMVKRGEVRGRLQ